MKLNVNFQQVVKENFPKMTDSICKVIYDKNVCPAGEGVPCVDCLKYALKILLEVNDHE